MAHDNNDKKHQHSQAHSDGQKKDQKKVDSWGSQESSKDASKSGKNNDERYCSAHNKPCNLCCCK